MSDFHTRLTRLRAELAGQSLDGFVLATGDEHLSEFVAPFSQRLAWLTGFTGTAASAAVLANKAAFFVDSRYTVLARELVDGADWSYQNMPQTSPGEWLAAEVEQDTRIGSPVRNSPPRLEEPRSCQIPRSLPEKAGESVRPP